MFKSSSISNFPKHSKLKVKYHLSSNKSNSSVGRFKTLFSGLVASILLKHTITTALDQKEFFMVRISAHTSPSKRIAITSVLLEWDLKTDKDKKAPIICITSKKFRVIELGLNNNERYQKIVSEAKEILPEKDLINLEKEKSEKLYNLLVGEYSSYSVYSGSVDIKILNENSEKDIAFIAFPRGKTAEGDKMIPDMSIRIGNDKGMPEVGITNTKLFHVHEPGNELGTIILGKEVKILSDKINSFAGGKIWKVFLIVGCVLIPLILGIVAFVVIRKVKAKKAKSRSK